MRLHHASAVGALIAPLLSFACGGRIAEIALGDSGDGDAVEAGRRGDADSLGFDSSVDDAGMPIADGGVPVVDGGVLIFDGGVPVVDGGVPVIDGGVPVFDGGTTDSGLPVVDAGTAGDCTGTVSSQLAPLTYDNACDNYFTNIGTPNTCAAGSSPCAAFDGTLGYGTFCCYHPPSGSPCATDYSTAQCIPQ